MEQLLRICPIPKGGWVYTYEFESLKKYDFFEDIFVPRLNNFYKIAFKNIFEVRYHLGISNDEIDEPECLIILRNYRSIYKVFNDHVEFCNIKHVKGKIRGGYKEILFKRFKIDEEGNIIEKNH